MKKILQVVSAPHRGGAETMILNIFREVDHTEFQYDFISHMPVESDYDQEISSYGGSVIYIDSLGNSGFIKYVKLLKNVMLNYGPYDAVHCHTNLQASAVMLAAYLANVKIRISHSHNTTFFSNKNFKSTLFMFIAKPMIRLFSTHFLACGREAGIAMYGRNTYDQGKVEIFNNGINIESFVNTIDNNTIRYETRDKLGIDKDCFVIGHIGRYHDQKNHEFIIEIAKELKKLKLYFKILLVGNGEKYEKIEKMIHDHNLADNVMQLGVRSDIPNLYAAFDVFILPSRYEGLPLVLIEAQAAGKMCIVSTAVTKDADMDVGRIKFIDVNNVNLWVETIQQHRTDHHKCDKDEIVKKITMRGYSASHNVHRLNSIYSDS